jgi:hypothetical protein
VSVLAWFMPVMQQHAVSHTAKAATIESPGTYQHCVQAHDQQCQAESREPTHGSTVRWSNQHMQGLPTCTAAAAGCRTVCAQQAHGASPYRPMHACTRDANANSHKTQCRYRTGTTVACTQTDSKQQPEQGRAAGAHAPEVIVVVRIEAQSSSSSNCSCSVTVEVTHRSARQQRCSSLHGDYGAARTVECERAAGVKKLASDVLWRVKQCILRNTTSAIEV